MKNYTDYLPEFLGVLLALLLLNVWYLSSLAIEEQILPVSLDYLYKGITVLIGAFVGAFSAFKLNSKKEERKTYSLQKLAMNKAIFINIRQINAVKNMHKLFSKYDSELDRAFKLPAMKPPSYKELKFNFEELSFLLEDHPQTMMNLVIEQERFEQAFNSIEIRNDFYVYEVQPILSELKLTNKDVPISDFSESIGERLFKGSIQGSNNMYFHIEETNKSIVEMNKELFLVAREFFPDAKFIKWEPTKK